MSLVLGSSAILAWIYSDEATTALDRLFEAITEEAAAVPALWQLEVADSLTVVVRRGRIDGEFRRGAPADLALLDIRTDPDTGTHAWTESVELADRSRLTMYEAACLELARRRALPLATLDEDLGDAGVARGIDMLGLGT